MTRLIKILILALVSIIAYSPNDVFPDSTNNTSTSELVQAEAQTTVPSLDAKSNHDVPMGLIAKENSAPHVMLLRNLRPGTFVNFNDLKLLQLAKLTLCRMMMRQGSHSGQVYLATQNGDNACDYYIYALRRILI